MFWFVSERSRVDKTKTLIEKSASKTRAAGGITMMSPDSTSQSTLVASSLHQDGACVQKRKKKRRKKANRVRAKKSGVARWNATTRGGSASSQEDSVGAELDGLSLKEPDTMDLSGEDFKPEAKLPSTKDSCDKKRDVVKLKSHQKRADNRLQGGHGAKDVDISDEGINKCTDKDDIKPDTMPMITKTKQYELKTLSRCVSEKQKQKLRETNSKTQQKGKKKSHDEAAPSIEDNGRTSILSEDPPNDRKAMEEHVCRSDDEEVDACLEDDTAIQINVSGSRRNQHNFGSQISDYDASQDANLIHRDEIVENGESQENIAYSQNVNEVEPSISLKRTDKEQKALQDPEWTKKLTEPDVVVDAKCRGRSTEKMDAPYGFEDHAKRGVRSRKHTVDRSIDRLDKKRNKQGTMEALCKQARIKRSPDNSFSAHDTSGSQVKQPKFFKSRHKERTGNAQKTVDSSDDVYSFEPTNRDNKRSMTSKNADRNGDDDMTEDELICGGEWPSKLTTLSSENSLHKHANKSRKLAPKDKKGTKGSKHSDAKRSEECESKYENAQGDKPKYKLKCLSTLRERIQTSVLYDFEDAVATNFGFDDDGEDEQASRSVRITTTQDTKKKRDSEHVAKENTKKKGNCEYAAKENKSCVERNMKRNARENSKAEKNSSLKVSVPVLNSIPCYTDSTAMCVEK